MSNDWKRVTRLEPCKICQHGDWCCVGKSFALCCRVESAKPAKNGNGWLHPLDAAPVNLPPPEKKPEPPKINCTRIMAEWRENTLREWVHEFAFNLGVESVALFSLGVAWAANRKAWAFPMFDGYREPIGIRLRTADGKKFAVTGSRQGLFLPDTKPESDIFVCEGPTDTAAMLSVGLYAIGRPSCLGCEDMVRDFVRQNKIQRVTIVADADEPGQRGAEKLQQCLKVKSKIWTPPAKDVREAVKNGLTKKTVESLTKDILWS